MSVQVKKEIIKALAYGKTTEEIKTCMGVSEEDINSISSDEVAAKRAELTEMGYVW